MAEDPHCCLLVTHKWTLVQTVLFLGLLTLLYSFMVTLQRPLDRYRPRRSANDPEGSTPRLFHLMADPGPKEARDKGTQSAFSAEDFDLDDVVEGASTLNNKVRWTPNCTEDCLKVKQMLRTWPGEKPKAALYYLANKDRFGWLINSLKHLKDNFNSKYQYPVIIFHESDFEENRRLMIKACVQDLIFFQEIQLEVSPYLARPVPKDVHCGNKTIGYKNMCRFQAITVYGQPIIQDFDYLCRMDDDSLFNHPVEFDIFLYMSAHNLSYGYRGVAADKQACVSGLWEASRHFVEQRDIWTHFFDTWPQGQIYYNNFEISRLALWQSQQYRQYAEYIDRLGGIYYHRWGDAPIKSIAVSLFVPLNETHHFGNLPYQHGTFVPVVTDTFDKIHDTDRVELYLQQGLWKILLNYTWQC